jgi:hypothetical protein
LIELEDFEARLAELERAAEHPSRGGNGRVEGESMKLLVRRLRKWRFALGQRAKQPERTSHRG